MAPRCGRRKQAMAAFVAATVASALLLVAPPALAKFNASASGSGKARAVLVAVPAAPTATFTGIAFLACTIHVAWTPAPPAGRQYTLFRVINNVSTPIQSGITTASSYDDTFLLAILIGSPSYFLRSTLTGTSWIKDSSATASHC